MPAGGAMPAGTPRPYEKRPPKAAVILIAMLSKEADETLPPRIP